MKKAMLLAIVIASVSPAAAQTANSGPSGTAECKLKLSQAPALRGIHLGMSVDQALGVFSETDKLDELRKGLKNAKFGVQSSGLNPGTTAARERFIGVSYVHLGFLDGELNFFSLAYDGPHWTDVDQFATRVAEILNLPGVASWKPALGGKAIACDGFEVSVQLPTENRGNSINVRNLERDVNTIVREREETLRNAARRAFKP